MYNFSLPIKIGCKVYHVREGYQRAINKTFRSVEYCCVPDTIEEGAVSMLQQKADESWKFRVSWKIDSSCSDFALSDLGKEVFLTEDEANIAMAAMKKKRSENALNGK